MFFISKPTLTGKVGDTTEISPSRYWKTFWTKHWGCTGKTFTSPKNKPSQSLECIKEASRVLRYLLIVQHRFTLTGKKSFESLNLFVTVQLTLKKKQTPKRCFLFCLFKRWHKWIPCVRSVPGSPVWMSHVVTRNLIFLILIFASE